ncbi:MAG: protein-L-isoaspartate(D-aspartate) O-methyltransferase [Candidatus Latescibacterota bacterium]|nr:MAG: protein-L-isoaspartate(D-aspartate) O-methyltransferase [Candidatus Latescibacterota bacterium]
MYWLGGKDGTDPTDPGEKPTDPFGAARAKMVENQIRRRGIQDPRVLHAMETVPRHLFVLPGDKPFAYDDNPLPIGQGQTISQPYIVALMTELLRIKPNHRVLEIGTGSGYQAAVLAMLAQEVLSIEYVEDLALSSEKLLRKLGYNNVTVKGGNGYAGWPERAPFDAIMVTAAPEACPHALTEQLVDGGRMAIPIGQHVQELYLIKREGVELKQKRIASVRFVPMVGEDFD